jgi:hypothetical protein
MPFLAMFKSKLDNVAVNGDELWVDECISAECSSEDLLELELDGCRRRVFDS